MVSNRSIEYSTAWIPLSEDRERFSHRWHAPETPLGTICIVHGLGEHGARYHRLARDLAHSGFDVRAFDQQGHGLSPEPRGCISSYESMLDDIQLFVEHTNSELALPILLFGHSMGGNLVLNYALRRNSANVQAVISSSPMIRTSRPPHWLVVMLGRVLKRFAPNYQLKSNVVAERLMGDPEEQQELVADELFHSQLSLRLGAALLDSGQWLLENAHHLPCPLLLTHGTNDYMTCPDASREFGQLAGEMCELALLPDQLHDPFRDSERSIVIRKFIDFAHRIRVERAP